MVSDSTLVILVSRHHDVAIHSPRRSPAVKKLHNYNKLKYLSGHWYNVGQNIALFFNNDVILCFGCLRSAVIDIRIFIETGWS